MKLDLGGHIRQNRRRMELTQEQLAEKFGVSPQAISRWEMGTTYPDLELLPTIAAFFGVSVDSLLSCDAETKNKICDERTEKFKDAAKKKDTDALISAMREIRRDLREIHGYWFWGLYNEVWRSRLHENPAVMEELRLLADAAADYCPDDVVGWMAVMEDEERLEDYLTANAAREDMTKTRLLLSRYRYRGDKERHEPVRQFHLWYTLEELIGARFNWEPMGRYDPALTKWYCEVNLSYLNAVNALPPKPLINCGPAVDFWCEEKITIGLLYAAALAKLGETDAALCALEEIASLMERIMALDKSGEFTLKCTSPALEDLTAKAEFFPIDEHDGFCHRELCMQIGEWSQWVSAHRYLLTLKNVWFDSIRDTDGFKACLARLEACDIRTPAGQ